MACVVSLLNVNSLLVGVELEGSTSKLTFKVDCAVIIYVSGEEMSGRLH